MLNNHGNNGEKSRGILCGNCFYSPPQDSVGLLWFHFGCPCICPSVRLSIRPSVHQSYLHLSIRILFLDDNLSKYQGIFIKLGMCIDIVEIWFRIANGQILSDFDRIICPRHDNGGVLSFYVFICNMFIRNLKMSFKHPLFFLCIIFPEIVVSKLLTAQFNPFIPKFLKRTDSSISRSGQNHCYK